MESNLVSVPGLIDNVNNFFANAINSVRGMFSSDDDEDARNTINAAAHNAVRTGLPSETQAVNVARYNDRVSAYEGAYNRNTTNAALATIGVPLGAVTSLATMNPVSMALTARSAYTGHNALQDNLAMEADLADLRNELGITENDPVSSLGPDRSAMNEGETMSEAARDAAGGYGSGNREEDNVRRTTTTPATEPTNPTNPTGPTAPGDATLPTDDLLDNAWQRFYAYQGAGGGTYNTNYYQRGPYAIRNETLGSDRNPPDYFSLF
jgi:hypothetical protein